MSFLISEFTVTNDKKTDETYTEASCYYHRRLHCCTLLSAAATEPRATMLNPKTKETQSKLIWKSYKYQQDLTRDFVHQVRLINSWTKTKYDKATLGRDKEKPLVGQFPQRPEVPVAEWVLKVENIGSEGSPARHKTPFLRTIWGMSGMSAGDASDLNFTKS